VAYKKGETYLPTYQPTCFGRLCAHHQEKQLCLCDTWYLIKFIELQNNRHPSQHTFGNIHKASGNCQQRLLKELNAEPLSHVLGLSPCLQNVRLS